MIYILLVMLALLMALSLLLFHGDIFAPAFIVCSVFFASTLACIYNLKYWKTDLSVITVCVIVGGCLVFLVISCLVQTISKQIYGCKNSKIKIRLNMIKVQRWKLYLVFAANLALIVLQLKFVQEVVSLSSNNLGSWGLKMEYYRNVVSYNTSGYNISIPTSISILLDFSTICAYVFLYICINNYLATDEKPTLHNIDFINTVPVVAYLTYNLLCGTRGSILMIFLGGVMIFHMLYHKKEGWNKKYSIKSLFKLMVYIILILFVFVMLRDIVGRRYSTTAANPLYYICTYVGGSIHLLDDFIKNPPQQSEIWGSETFYSIIRFLGQRLHIDEWIYISHLEYRESNGLNVGNVYTAFRKYIYDFGYGGVLWCTALVSTIYSSLYYKIKYKRKINEYVDIPIMFYGYITYGLFYMSIQEQPLSTLLCMTTILMPLLYRIALYFLLDVKIGKGLKNTRKKIVIRTRL